MILTKDHKVWKSKSNDNSYSRNDLFEPISLSIMIISIACNSEASLFLSNTHEVFGVGSDSCDSGIFVDFLSSDVPRLIQELSGKSLKQVSLGAFHGAGVDDSGFVYTWGTGTLGELGGLQLNEVKAPPLMIDRAQRFSVKKVVCGNSFTCMCTGGGYVYILGVIGSHHQTSKRSQAFLRTSQKSLQSPKGMTSSRREIKSLPYTISELEQHFITDISAGDEFLYALSDQGVIYAFDGCMDLVRLPSDENYLVKSIGSVNKTIFGMTNKGCFYEWKEPNMELSSTNMLNTLIEAGKSICSLATWSGSLYKIDQSYTNPVLASNHIKGLALIFESQDDLEITSLGELIDIYEPYKRDLFTHHLIHSVFESLDAPLISTPNYYGSPSSYVKKSQESIYPLDFQDQMFDKVVRHRLEYEQTEQINKSLTPIFYEILEHSFKKLCDFSKNSKTLEKTLNKTILPNLIVRYMSKIKSKTLILGFSNIRTAWYAKIIENVEKNKKTGNKQIESAAKIMSKILNTIIKRKRIQFYASFIGIIRVKNLSYKYRRNIIPLISRIYYQKCSDLLQIKWNLWKNYNQSHHENIKNSRGNILTSKIDVTYKGSYMRAITTINYYLIKMSYFILKKSLEKWNKNSKSIKPKLIEKHTILYLTALIRKHISKAKYQIFNSILRYTSKHSSNDSSSYKFSNIENDLQDHGAFSSNYNPKSHHIDSLSHIPKNEESYDSANLEEFSKVSSKYKDSEFSIFSIINDEKALSKYSSTSIIKRVSNLDRKICNEDELEAESLVVINKSFQKNLVHDATGNHVKFLPKNKQLLTTNRSNSNEPSAMSRKARSLSKPNLLKTIRSGSSNLLKTDNNPTALRQKYASDLKERQKRHRLNSTSNTSDREKTEEKLVDKCVKLLGNLKPDKARPPRPKKIEIKLKSRDTTKSTLQHSFTFEDLSMRFSLGAAALKRVIERTAFIYKYFSFSTIKDHRRINANFHKINNSFQKSFLDNSLQDEKKLERIWHWKLYKIGLERLENILNKCRKKRSWCILNST